MLADLWHRARALLRRSAVERDLDDELQAHVEHQTRKYLEQGLTHEEAARRVRLEFGGLDQVKEECRDARGIGLVEESVRNLRHAIRALAKRPAFTAVAMLTLALGIGANSAVFSLINTILLRPLSFPDGGRLVRIEQQPAGGAPAALPFVAPVRLEDWRRLNATFQAVTGYYADDISEASGDLPERLAAAWVAPGFFETWQVVPAIGRVFMADEQRFGGPPAAVVSERLWRRRFGAPSTIGDRVLRVGDRTYPIVGIMPASFRFPIGEVDVWMPSPVDAPYAQDRRVTW